VFRISGLDKCSSYSIKIYNRWGSLIFETEKPDFVWDGITSAGTKAQEGTYYYVLKNSTVSKTGFISLLR
jgi:gliding motility-associated-like protein